MRPSNKATMRGRSNNNVWACTPCALLLLSAVVPREAAALFQGSGIRDTVHKVFKVKVTEEMHSIWSDDPRMMKRGGGDGSVCPASYSLCSASLGGNCCPENYACSKDYCYATTAATSTSTCGGQVGYYACALSLGGGCCPQGVYFHQLVHANRREPFAHPSVCFQVLYAQRMSNALRQLGPHTP